MNKKKLLYDFASKFCLRASPDIWKLWEPRMNAFTLLGPKWLDDHITWSFAAKPFDEDTSAPFAAPISVVWQHFVEQAFARWAAVSGLAFEEVPDATGHASAADIRIGWGISAQRRV